MAVIKKTTKVAVKTATSVQHKKTGAIVKEEVKEMVEVPAAYANVGVTASRTIPLQDYANVKIGVSIHRPCANTEDAIEQCYDFCIEWVNERMEALCEAHDKPKDD